MKVLVVSTYVLPTPPTDKDGKPSYGGIERVVWTHATELANRGIDVTVAVTKGSVNDNKKIKVIEGPEPTWTFTRDGGTIFYDTIAHLMDDYDVIHDFSHLHFRARKRDNASTLNMMWVNGTDRIPIPMYNNIALSKWQSNVIAKIYRVRADPLGMSMDENFFKPISERKVEDYIVFLSRFAPEKGVHHAIEAAHTAGTPIYILGDLPPAVADRSGSSSLHDKYQQEYFKKIRGLANKYKEVVFVGSVSQKEKVRYLQRAKATILPARMADPHSLVVIESTLCGTPVIGINENAYPEINPHGITGYNMNNESLLHIAINNIHRLDRKIVREYALQHYSHSKVIPVYINRYKQVMNGYRW